MTNSEMIEPLALLDKELQQVEREHYDGAMEIAWICYDPDDPELGLTAMMRRCTKEKIRISREDAESMLEFCKNTLIGETHE